MKLIIQIPCFNEEETLSVTLADLPRQLEGVDCVEWLIIDDGSQDKTIQTAIEYGVDYVIHHVKNLGLAQGFLSGINACVELGADIIVNTDADNQYCAQDIQKLIDPILERKADFVVGTRPIENTDHFSPLKKKLQKFGSWVVRQVSQTDVEDAPSGFRAISRSAAMQLHVFNRYTYTLETVIQAGRMNIATVSVPIRTNEDLRASRLISSIPKYLRKSFTTIIRSFLTYEPLRFFGMPVVLSFLFASILGIRYLSFYFAGEGGGHIQSLLLAVVLVVLGVALLIIGLLADLVSVNRKLLENIDTRLRILDADYSERYPKNNHARVFSKAYLVYSSKDSIE